MKLQYLIISYALILSSCVAKHSFKVAHTSNSDSLKKTSGVYFLPQTRINIDITASKTVHIQGPYQDFAQKYLGININTDENTSFWEIDNISVSTEEEIDPEQFYLVETNQMNSLIEKLLILNEKGLVMLNPPYIPSMHTNILKEDENKTTEISSNKTAVKKNVIEKRDTLYKTVLTDTSFIRIPIIKKQTLAKSVAKNAEEAAAFIIKLRKRRFKLISGQYENYQKKDALALSIEELNKLEEEYMSLFIGKTYTKTQKTFISLIPTMDSTRTITIPLTGFSKENGFEFLNENAKEILLSINKENNYTALDSINFSSKKGVFNNTLLYRIPGDANIGFTFEKEFLAKIPVTIYQFGTVVPFSVK